MSPALTPERLRDALASLAVRLPPRARLLVAVSGGPDSVVLADLLRQLSNPIVIAHVNHGLRGAAAADARFVKALAERWDVPYLQKTLAVGPLAIAMGMGLEEGARVLRYRALAAMARRSRCSAIVTGHHADDQAETVLMNFLRGSGPSGLAGIPPDRPLEKGLRLLRPLLGTTRREIMTYLKSRHLHYVQDQSNWSRRFFRNRIRHQTLPELERLQPGLRDRLRGMAEIFRDEEDFWNRQKALRSTLPKRLSDRRIVIDLPTFFGYHKSLSRRILHTCLPGLSFPDFEKIMLLGRSAAPSGSLSFRGGWRITKNANRLIIRGGKTK